MKMMMMNHTMIYNNLKKHDLYPNINLLNSFKLEKPKIWTVNVDDDDHIKYMISFQNVHLFNTFQLNSPGLEFEE